MSLTDDSLALQSLDQVMYGNHRVSIGSTPAVL